MKQKIGLLVDDFSASKQLKDFIDLSLTANNYEITTLIVNDHTIYSEKLQKKIKRYVGKKGVLNLLNRALFLIVSKIERKIIERKQQYKNFYRTYDLSENGFEVIVVSPIKSKSGLSHSYSCKDIEKIRNADLRLLVRAGKGILRGDILTCCPSGIISFHHGDNEINRGGPAGFWEVYKKQPRTGFIIQRLTEKLDGGDVLFKGFIRTSWFYTLNKVKLYEVSNPFLHKIIFLTKK